MVLTKPTDFLLTLTTAQPGFEFRQKIHQAILAGDLVALRRLCADFPSDKEAGKGQGKERVLLDLVDLAIKRDRVDLMDFILAQVSPASLSQNLSPLCIAAGESSVSTLEHLLAKGSDVNEVSIFQTPLSCAALHNRVDNIEWLIARGADVHLESEPEMNAMAAALVGRSIAAAVCLIGHGAFDRLAQEDIQTMLDGRPEEVQRALLEALANREATFLDNASLPSMAERRASRL